MIIDFKQQFYSIINNNIKIIRDIDQNIHLDDFFNEDIVANEILKKKESKKIKPIKKARMIINKANLTINQYSNESQETQQLYNESQESQQFFNESQASQQFFNESQESQLYEELPPDYPFHKRIHCFSSTIPYFYDLSSVMDPKTFVFHVLSSGLNPHQAKKLLNAFQNQFFFYAQNALSPIVIAATKESIKYCKSKMKKGARAMFDGAWSHMRNAYQHHAILIEFLLEKSLLHKLYLKMIEQTLEIMKIKNLLI